MYERLASEDGPRLREKRYPAECPHCGTPNPSKGSRCANCDAQFGEREAFPDEPIDIETAA